MQQLILAALLSAAVTILLGPVIIPLLKRLKFGQTERNDGPRSHLAKQGTPTMGGIIFLTGLTAGTLVFTVSGSEFAIPALLITFAFSLVGFLDDFIKVKLKRSLGLKAYQKIIGQFGIALIVALYCYYGGLNDINWNDLSQSTNVLIGSKIYLPFWDVELELGLLYIPFAMFVIIGAVNSVNLTDGLDGLASGVTMIYSVSMSLIFLFISNELGQAGKVYQSAAASGMIIFAGSVAGACLGFLRFNSFPARVFMGDTGSLALGGAISVMALFSRAVLLLPVMGACFVASAVSVILQVGSYKLRKKRIFRMAPLHHHFELKGVAETRIVSVYMIITAVLCLICLLAYA